MSAASTSLFAAASAASAAAASKPISRNWARRLSTSTDGGLRGRRGVAGSAALVSGRATPLATPLAAPATWRVGSAPARARPARRPRENSTCASRATRARSARSSAPCVRRRRGPAPSRACRRGRRSPSSAPARAHSMLRARDGGVDVGGAARRRGVLPEKRSIFRRAPAASRRPWRRTPSWPSMRKIPCDLCDATSARARVWVWRPLGVTKSFCLKSLCSTPFNSVRTPRTAPPAATERNERINKVKK